MSDNLSCLPQSKHLLSLYDDVSDVETFSWIERRSLKWAWYIKQAQLGLCDDKISSLPSGELGGDNEWQ